LNLKTYTESLIAKIFVTIKANVALKTHNHDDKYLGKTAKAVDTDKLDGKNGSYFVSKDELPSLLPTSKPIAFITNLENRLNELVKKESGKALVDISSYSSLLQDVQHLKDLIYSDDTTLDEMQEIVNFIKQNKSTLDSLSIGNIAGLESALNEKALASDVANLFSIPVGTIMYFSTTNPPEGFLFADGSELSRTDFSDLFSVVGTTFGEGDGSSTFNIPDLRGEFIRGWDAGRGVDSGRVFGSIQLDDFKEHSHLYSSATPCYDGVDSVTVNSGDTCFPQKPTQNEGGTETRPRNIALLPCIKY